MDKVFFEKLKLPEPKYNLNIGSGTHAEEIGKMLIAIKNTSRQKTRYNFS